MLFPNIAVPEQVYKEITARGGKDFLADGIPERKNNPKFMFRT